MRSSTPSDELESCRCFGANFFAGAGLFLTADTKGCDELSESLDRSSFVRQLGEGLEKTTGRCDLVDRRPSFGSGMSQTETDSDRLTDKADLAHDRLVVFATSVKRDLKRGRREASIESSDDELSISFRARLCLCFIRPA